MPRGRPKKKVIENELENKMSSNNNAADVNNDATDIPEVEVEETTEQTIKGRKSTSKQYPLCTRCGKPITTTTPFRVNLAYLTSVASYHRNVVEDVPTLCNECAKGLSDAVDKYLINGGAKKKFERD